MQPRSESRSWLQFFYCIKGRTVKRTQGPGVWGKKNDSVYPLTSARSHSLLLKDMILKNSSSALGAQKINEGQLVWFKMPTDILSDERVEKLIAETGVPGFGLYIYLVCEIMRHRKHCMTRDCIMSIKIKGHTKATLKRIVEDYGLFTDDGKGHIFSSIDFLCKGYNRDTANGKSDCGDNRFADQEESKLFATGCKSDSIPTPPRALQKREEENKKEITSPKNLMMAMKSYLDPHSSWAEMVMMKSRTTPLLRRHWDYAVELFIQHVVSQAKEESVMNENDARRYFCNFCTSNHTGAILAARLAEYNSSHPEQNPYRFEDEGSAPGHRSYLGSTLPDDALPRPSKTADWVDGNWVDAFADNNNNNIYTKTLDYDY